MFQFELFPPEVTLWGKSELAPSPEDVKKTMDSLGEINTGYDNAAIASYARFRKLKDGGVIPPQVKFQVCLPSVVSVVVCLQVPYRTAIESMYREAVLRALARIQAEIPSHELAIQFDITADRGIIEGLSVFQKWWPESALDGVVARFLPSLEAVLPEVDVCLHQCYGDIEHKHWREPDSTATMVSVANGLIA